MRSHFVESVLLQLVRKDILHRDDSIVAVCAGKPEKEVFKSLQFKNVTITNLDDGEWVTDYSPYAWSSQDAMNMSFGDKEYDFAFVSDGLHHCSSPHRAVLEMYRVSKRGIIVIESRDSLLMRLAVRLGFSPEYEVGSVEYHQGKCGGVDNTEIPNYIYRWTEREFVKTIRSGDPVGKHAFIFINGFNPPVIYSASWGKRVLKAVLIAVLSALMKLAKKQGNAFAMVALRPNMPNDLWPWLCIQNNKIKYSG